MIILTFSMTWLLVSIAIGLALVAALNWAFDADGSRARAKSNAASMTTYRDLTITDADRAETDARYAAMKAAAKKKRK